jgi:hypothetical protein
MGPLDSEGDTTPTRLLHISLTSVSGRLLVLTTYFFSLYFLYWIIFYAGTSPPPKQMWAIPLDQLDGYGLVHFSLTLFTSIMYLSHHIYLTNSSRKSEILAKLSVVILASILAFSLIILLFVKGVGV